MNNTQRLLGIIQDKEKLKDLALRYNVTPGMTKDMIWDNFVATENLEREEFFDRMEAAQNLSKKRYWAARASGLTTHGGQTRLRKLLRIAA